MKEGDPVRLVRAKPTDLADIGNSTPGKRCGTTGILWLEPLDGLLGDFGFVKEFISCGAPYVEFRTGHRQVVHPDWLEPDGCVCDIRTLMMAGCRCGFLQREKR